MHIRALSVDIGASGSFWGSLNGLEIAISLCDSAPIYIQCTWYMLGTNAATRMASQEAVQDQNKHKCCIRCVFVIVFFSVSKSGNMNNWHVQGADPTGP